MNINRGLVEINDEKQIKSDAKDAAHIGELKISVFKKQILSQGHGKQRLMKGEAKLEIAEKAVKGRALSHGTS
jgi:type VI protein secretion system component Hcp